MDGKFTSVNNKEQMPFRHYRERFCALDPQEAAQRCGAAFDGSAFCVRLLGTEYRLAWPAYAITSERENAPVCGSLLMQTFLLRWLCDGKRATPSERMLTFRELPWGEVYVGPFTGRCLKRAAFAFGTRLDAFRKASEALGGVKCTHGDAAYRFTLLDGYCMELIVWEGDDEFQPSSQLLFSDNFAEGFSAEDRVVASDILITTLKQQI